MDHALNPASNVLITGATGFIGGELVQRLDDYTEGTIWSLVRARKDEQPLSRLATRYWRSGNTRKPGPRVQAVVGDVTLPFWGLDAEDLNAITRNVDIIIHSAADTSFADDHDTSQTNVVGVRNLIEFARRCVRQPLIVYVSTASNSGKAAHCCLREEDGCQPDNHHFNGYTHSKAVAEALLRESGLPLLNLRPTIVLSAGLPDSGFAKQILWCVPLTRCFRALPLDPDSHVDLADVGFVADAALDLLRKPSRRFDCYHLSAGKDNAVTIGQLREVVMDFYRRKEHVILIPPKEWTVSVHRKYIRTQMQKQLFHSLRYYLPFLNMDVIYDDARLRAELGEAAPAVASPVDYFPGLLRLIRQQAALREAALP
jgi:thioester reductase-like protein